MREKFTDDEWQLIRTLPFQVWVAVAAADGNIDEAEAKFLDADLKEGALAYKDPLMREIATDFYRSSVTGAEMLAAAAEAFKSEAAAARIKTILDDKLTKPEQERFWGGLVILGMDTARASGGGGFLKKKDPISEEEKKALFIFTIKYGIDLQKSLSYFKE